MSLCSIHFYLCCTLVITLYHPLYNDVPVSKPVACILLTHCAALAASLTMAELIVAHFNTVCKQ